MELVVRGSKERVNVVAEFFVLRMKDGAFAVTVPQFDDWTQTIDFNLREADVVIAFKDGQAILEFPDQRTREKFESWLDATNTAARQGYRTMWP